MLFKTYLKEVEETVDLVVTAEADALPPNIQTFRDGTNLGESMDSVRDLILVVAADAKELKSSVTQFTKQLAKE